MIELAESEVKRDQAMTESIGGEHAEKENVIPFAKEFNHLSPADLDNIMEWLYDHNYLSVKGHVFQNKFWALFIKE